ncbi:chromatin target of PRMT1 protein-like [Uloborus diversus]|uniref:chromatin target of PRMT1 protein-like n=1 Tax=Uloborus diversus TaxID=327109 RepID=UPI00240A9898|nr:chromatin target of PRMT1 protein-like [Uloborus diversus]
MASVPIAKILLKNTTKMSLNERFTAYRAQAQSAANIYRQKIQLQRQASSASSRLAQQMANRPTVIAALRLKKKSLQQRLGRKQQSANGNIKARLNIGGKRFINNSVRGRLGGGRNKGIRRGGLRPGTSPLLKGRLGMPKTGNFNYNLSNQRTNLRNKRGNFRGRGNRPFRGGNRQQQPQRKNLTRNTRGRGGGRGRGRGGRWTEKAVGPLPTKQELDNQLDEYMAETKSNLDAQLGQYMSQA